MNARKPQSAHLTFALTYILTHAPEGASIRSRGRGGGQCGWTYVAPEGSFLEFLLCVANIYQICLCYNFSFIIHYRYSVYCMYPEIKGRSFLKVLYQCPLLQTHQRSYSYNNKNIFPSLYISYSLSIFLYLSIFTLSIYISIHLCINIQCIP